MMYKVRRHRTGAACVRLAPAPGIEISGIGDNPVDAADRGLAFVEEVSKTPLGALLPPGTGALAGIMRRGVRAATSGKLDEVLAPLSPSAQRHVRNFLHRVFG